MNAKNICPGPTPPPPPPVPPPVQLLLWCPQCSERHIDEGVFADTPHHTHACQHCGFCWRPAVVDTCGVQFLPGFRDWPAPPTLRVVKAAETPPAAVPLITEEGNALSTARWLYGPRLLSERNHTAVAQLLKDVYRAIRSDDVNITVSCVLNVKDTGA